MNKILILLFIPCLLPGFTSVQNVSNALLTSPQIGSENYEFFPRDMVENFSYQRKLDMAAKLGNENLDGEYYDFTSAEILDSTQIINIDDSATVIKSIKFNRTTFSPIITSNDKNYISTSVGLVICLGREGEIIWEYHTNGLIYSSLLKDKDLIIAMTSEGDLFTINANNGDLVQVIGIGESITSDIRLIDLEYNQMNTKGIVFGTEYGNIYCYEIYSLEMVWENYLTEKRIVSDPLVINNKIIYETTEDYYCVNAKNGSLIWRWQKDKESEENSFQSDLISDGFSIFYINKDGKLVSIDLMLGTSQWKKEKRLSASGKLFITANKNKLFVHSTKNQLLVVNHSTGKVIKKIVLPDELKNALPVCIIENGLETLLGFDNGLICKLDSEDKITTILFSSNSPVISIVSLGEKEYLTNNLNGDLTHFILQ